MSDKDIGGWDRAMGLMGGGIVGAGLSITALVLMEKWTSITLDFPSIYIVLSANLIMAIVGFIYPKPFAWLSDALSFW